MGGGTDLWPQQKSLYIRWHLAREIVGQEALVCMVLVPLGQSVELHPNQSGSGNCCGSKSYPTSTLTAGSYQYCGLASPPLMRRIFLLSPESTILVEVCAPIRQGTLLV
jgi:hypothetical protein